MNRDEGIKEINDAKWKCNSEYELLELMVHDKLNDPVTARLKLRPAYCDRGHVQLNIDASVHVGIDQQDSFPRYFFDFSEADQHTRMFLKWRLWKERTVKPAMLKRQFELIKSCGRTSLESDHPEWL